MIFYYVFVILDEERSDDLLKVTVPIVPNAKCNSAYKSYKEKLPNGIDDDCHLCAGGQRGKDTCQVSAIFRICLTIKIFRHFFKHVLNYLL